MRYSANQLACVAILTVCGLCLAGCGQETATDGDAKVIGASLLTKTHVFFQDLSSTMEAEAKERGLTLRMQFCEFDGTKQNDQLETFILQGVDVIVVSPQDSAGIAPAIKEAQAKGIAVFTVDIAAHGAEVVSHIASDNVTGGRIIGEYLAKVLNGEGQVAIVDHPGTASVQERVAGFEEALAKHPGMIIVQKAPGEGQRDKAKRVTQDLLQRHSDLKGIFGINDDSALGALAAVETAGLQDKIVIVGYDGTPEAREAILAGKALKADTVQYPEEIGRRAIETIDAYLRGEEVEKVIPVKVGVIDQASLKAEQNQ